MLDNFIWPLFNFHLLGEEGEMGHYLFKVCCSNVVENICCLIGIHSPEGTHLSGLTFTWVILCIL